MNLRRIGQIAAVKTRGGPAMLAGIITIDGRPINLQLRPNTPRPGEPAAYDVWIVGEAPILPASTKAQPAAAVGYKANRHTTPAELRAAIRLLTVAVQKTSDRLQTVDARRRADAQRDDQALRALRHDVTDLRKAAEAERARQRTRRFFNLP